MILRDRQDERAVLDRLLEGAPARQGSVLVMQGEAGIGKTALLDYAIESATDLRTLRAVGVESEAELAFAALHQLCAPLVDRLDLLPKPQRDALMDDAQWLDRASAPRRPLERADRGAAVHQPAHRCVPPAHGVRQARPHLAQPARPGATRGRRPAAGVSSSTNHAAHKSWTSSRSPLRERTRRRRLVGEKAAAAG
jgi:hypothetical protein